MGSVSANPASLRPAARSGRKRSFCSSEPNIVMPLNPIDWWTPIPIVREPFTWPIASNTRAYPVWESPFPPYSSGTWRPISPSSPRSR